MSTTNSILKDVTNMEHYRANRKGLKSKPTFSKRDEETSVDVIGDYYVSLFLYNSEHLKHYTETGSVSGITDTLADKLYWDFDSKTDLELARKDTLEVIKRLEALGITNKEYRLYYSGNKGFNLEFGLDRLITNAEFKSVVLKLGEGLETFDTVVNDPNRIIRVPDSKHQVSGLYKIAISKNELTFKTIDEIKELAKTPRKITGKKNNVEFVGELAKMAVPTIAEKPKVEIVNGEYDFKLDNTNKPKEMDMARWYLQNGIFGEGERHYAYLCLAATYRSQGLTKEHIGRLLKGVDELHCKRTGRDSYPKTEIWAITDSVCSPLWRGGQFSVHDPKSWLHDYAVKHGIKEEEYEEAPLYTLNKVSSTFKDFALNIDDNTIKIGLQELDEEVRVTTSMLVLLLAGPAAGKTSTCFNILNNTSKQGIKSIFFSLDMGLPLVFQRLMQRQTGWSSDFLFDAYKTNSELVQKKEAELFLEYNNTSFCFKSGLTVEMIRDNILAYKEQNGEFPKLVMVDYLDCISGPHSDPTANTGFIAQALKDVANEFNICVFLLVQPQKTVGDASKELLSMRNVKGSSIIEQAASIIYTIWRPGFSPETPERDKFLSVAVVKNRMGKLGRFDFRWEGVSGRIRSLEDSERYELKNLLEQKNQEEEEENSNRKSKWDL